MSDQHAPRAHDRDVAARKIEAMLAAVITKMNTRKWAVEQAVQVAVAFAKDGAMAPMVVTPDATAEDLASLKQTSVFLTPVVASKVEPMVSVITRDLATWIAGFVEGDAVDLVKVARDVIEGAPLA